MIHRFLSRNEIETVHAHMEFALLSALNIKRTFNRIKIFYTVHNAFGFLDDKSLKPQFQISKDEFSFVDMFIFVQV